MKKQTKLIVAILAGLLLIAGMIGAYTMFAPKAETGAKSVTLNVVDNEGQTTSYEVQTDAEYLIEVMDEAKEDGFRYDGEVGDYGFALYTVNGITADFNVDSSYWAIMVNGEYGQYAVDQQPVADSDTYSIEYTVME